MGTIFDPNTIYKAKLNEKDFYKLQRIIEGEYGIKMPLTKKDMLEARLRKRLKTLSFANFSQYFDTPKWNTQSVKATMFGLIFSSSSSFATIVLHIIRIPSSKERPYASLMEGPVPKR